MDSFRIETDIQTYEWTNPMEAMRPSKAGIEEALECHYFRPAAIGQALPEVDPGPLSPIPKTIQF